VINCTYDKRVNREKKETIPAKFGNLPPKYRVILNPHKRARFSTCPNCSGKTLVCKVPLFIPVQPTYPMAIDKHCRYFLNAIF